MCRTCAPPPRLRKNELEEAHRQVEQALAWLGIVPAGRGRAQGGAPRDILDQLTADLEELWASLLRDLEGVVREHGGKTIYSEDGLQSAVIAFQYRFQDLLTASVEQAVQAGMAHAADQLGDVSFGGADAGVLQSLRGQAINLCEATAAKIRGDVRHQLLESVRLGENLTQTIQRLESISSLTTYEAERIARTELAKAANAGRLMGYQGRVTHVVWVLGPTYNGGCACGEMAGTYTLEEAAGLSMPLHPNCDCLWRPATDEEIAAAGD